MCIYIYIYILYTTRKGLVGFGTWGCVAIHLANCKFEIQNMDFNMNKHMKFEIYQYKTWIST